MTALTYSLSRPDNIPVTLAKRENLDAGGKYLRLRLDTLQRVDGTLFQYEVLDKASSSVILPITKAGEMILIDQFRYPLMDWELECPAGMPDAGESFRDAAIRELREEVGYEVGQIVDMGRYASSGGTTNELAHAFVATDCEHVPGAEARERDECIVVNRVPLLQVAAFLAARRAQGQIINPKMATLAYGYLLEGVVGNRK